MVLWGIFTGRQKEIDWLYKEGASYIRPEAFEEYLDCIPNEADKKDPLKAYYKLLAEGDEDVKLKAARAFSKWETTCSKV